MNTNKFFKKQLSSLKKTTKQKKNKNLLAVLFIFSNLKKKIKIMRTFPSYAKLYIFEKQLMSSIVIYSHQTAKHNKLENLAILCILFSEYFDQ